MLYAYLTSMWLLTAYLVVHEQILLASVTIGAFWGQASARLLWARLGRPRTTPTPGGLPAPGLRHRGRARPQPAPTIPPPPYTRTRAQLAFLGHDLGHNCVTDNRFVTNVLSLMTNAFLGVSEGACPRGC
jgi:hypothetical protein